jgi:hydroxyethylthiazole kinase-like uncharacterized protein yjeF
MPQYIVRPEDIAGDTFSVNGEEARHLVKSVRIKPGDTIYLIALPESGERGRRYNARVESVSPGPGRGAWQVSGRIVCEAPLPEETRPPVNVYAALIKPDRFELMLEKLTEIGVEGITPVVTERTVKEHSRPSANRTGRWRKVMRAAAKQCCCDKLPVLRGATDFHKALAGLPRGGLNLIAWEHYLDEKRGAALLRRTAFPEFQGAPVGHSPSLTAIIRRNNPAAVNVFFGPEGGFTDEEITAAREAGLVAFSLGKNIMRAETATVVAAGAALMALSGESGRHGDAVSVEKMRELDKKAIDEYGIPGMALMENAGKEIAAAALELAPAPASSGAGEGPAGCSAAIFCGSGNNGGDGLVAARFLKNAGCGVKVFLAGKPENFRGDALVNLNISHKMGIMMEELTPGNFADLASFNVIVDALIGTGLKENVSGVYREAIDVINRSGMPVVSADIPSGLDGDTGKPMGAAVRAVVTVSMGFIKKGFLESGASDYTGRIIVADIGIPV